MNQYLVEWANGTFQILTAEQLRKELDEWAEGWGNNPRPVYRLIPGQAPKRYHIIFGKNHDYWYLEDDFRNHLMIL